MKSHDTKYRMINLLPAIGDLEQEKVRIVEEMNRQIDALDQSIAVLRRVNQACHFCRGQGWSLRPRVTAEDDRPNPADPADRITCKACHGTGWKHWKDDEGIEHSAETTRISVFTENLS